MTDLAVDRLAALVRAVPKAQRIAILEAVREVVDVHVQARQRLEKRIAGLEVAADAEARIKALCQRAEQQIDAHGAELSKVRAQLDALLAPTASARRTAAARLRQ